MYELRKQRWIGSFLQTGGRPLNALQGYYFEIPLLSMVLCR